MPVDFDPVVYEYDWYETFLKRFRDAGYEFRTFDEPTDDGGVFLRHDVDWFPAKAARMAKLEANLGISSTYFILITSPFYNALTPTNREHIREIASLGHRIGLHFDLTCYFEGIPDENRLADRIRTDTTVLETIVDDVDDVVAFHNPPEWVLSRRFEDITSTYEPRFFDEISYTSDSLQRWCESPPFDAESSLPSTVQILTHPTLWGDEHRNSVEQIRTARDDLLDQFDEEMESTSPVEW